MCKCVFFHRYEHVHCSDEYGTGWWFHDDKTCLQTKLTGVINPVREGEGMYWPNFPDPENDTLVPLRKVLMRLIDIKVNATSKFYCVFLP